MAGLPKIALARLKAKPGALKSSGGPEGTPGLPSARHPDANLLAAFAEQALSERERTRVLHHLAQCAECRQVAAFALRAEEAAAEPARVAATRRWSPWLVLRWGALAAVLGALTIVVVLHNGRWQGHQEMAKKMPPAAPAGNVVSAPATVSTPPEVPPPRFQAPAQPSLELREASRELGAIKKPSPAPESFALSHQAARAQAKQQVTVMPSVQAPAAVKVESVPEVKGEQETGTGGALAAAAPAAPLAVPSPSPARMIASDEEAKAAAVAQPAPTAFRATTQSVAATAAPPGASSAEAVTAGVTPRTAAQPAPRLTAQASMLEVRAARKVVESQLASPAALWSVTPAGNVRRSTDGGKTFERIPIAHGTKFRAIAALGNEVWTGGTGGALFHSSDGGASWTQTAIDFRGRTVTETITGIQIHDSQHLTVTTASGSQWVSEDGGQHWR